MAGDTVPPPYQGPGQGQTPGFWKNHLDIFYTETWHQPSESYETIFEVDVKGSKWLSSSPTLEQALSAKGGGEAALLRASTAAWANANSDDVNFVIDASALKGGVTEAYGLDPTSLDYAAQLEAALTAVLQTLDIIDKNNDGIIQNHEVTNVVQDVYDATGFWGTTNYFSWGDLEAVTKALDSMNNMPHVDSGLFVV